MKLFWDKHVFTAELPYEKDQVITLFLKERFKRVDVFIMSLGQMSNIPPSKLLLYQNKKLLDKKTYTKNNYAASGLKLYIILIPKALFYVTLDMLRALKTVDFKCDIFFAQHFLPAFIAITLRRLGILKCDKIIFWMFDFFPIPSEFPRSLYYRGMDMIQRHIRKHVDEIWYTTPRLMESDVKRFGKLPRKVKTRLTHGCFFRRITYRNPPSIPPLRLAFLGSLRRDTAIYESIDALVQCLKKDMEVELSIIGSGPEEKYVKEYVRKKKIRHFITYYGYVDDGKKIAKILSKCHLGLALYPAYPNSPNWFLTSGKCRRYISQGLPIVISTVPYFAKYVHDYKAGIIVDTDPDSVYRALFRIYKKPSLLNTMRHGVDKLYDQYKADIILEKAFGEMLK